MIGWFEDNPVGIALASISAGLVLVSLLLIVIWSFPAAAPEDSLVDNASGASLELPELAENEPIDAYAVVTERPVFNESRQPEIELELAEEPIEEESIEEEVEAPEVELAGVVITPSVRMVTLKQKGSAESLVAFEGKPLEGDYGTWHVSRIGPRDVTLASLGGQEVELTLQVHDERIDAPQKKEPSATAEAAAASAADSQAGSDEPLSRAEEIRQRIAERREELRRAAEEAEQSGGGQDAGEQEPPAQPDYRQAIQSMISGNRKSRTEKEDEK